MFLETSSNFVKTTNSNNDKICIKVYRVWNYLMETKRLPIDPLVLFSAMFFSSQLKLIFHQIHETALVNIAMGELLIKF